jgi:hypothetical protein
MPRSRSATLRKQASIYPGALPSSATATTPARPAGVVLFLQEVHVALTKSDIINKARGIVGNKTENSAGEVMIDDVDIDIELAPAIRELNKIYGSSVARKEQWFVTVANQQAYSIAGVIGTDVSEIEEVLRSGSYLPDHLLDGSCDRFLGCNGQFNGDCVIPAGLQADTFRAIVQQHRAELTDQFTYQIRGDVLRLIPVPTCVEQVMVTYTTTSLSIETLPDETETALVYAASVALLDAMLNRIGADKITRAIQGMDTTDTRIKTLKDQRDRYERKYRAESNSLGKGSE